MASKTFGYARVSTVEQNLDRQCDLLRDYGVAEEDIYLDKISGSQLSRPSFNALQAVLRSEDVVIVESFSRIS